MADSKISALTSATTLVGTEVVPVVQGGTTKKVAISSLGPLEVANYAALPGTGTAGMQYITQDTNIMYRWTGSAYVGVGGNLGDLSTNGFAALGVTVSGGVPGSTLVDALGNAPTAVQGQWIPRTGTAAALSTVTLNPGEIAVATDKQLTFVNNSASSAAAPPSFRNKTITKLVMQYPAQTIATTAQLVGYPASGDTTYAEGSAAAAYVQTAGTVSVTQTAHGYSTGRILYVLLDTGSFAQNSGLVTITVDDANTYHFTSPGGTTNDTGLLSIWSGRVATRNTGTIGPLSAATFDINSTVQVTAGGTGGTYFSSTFATTGSPGFGSRLGMGARAGKTPLITGQNATAYNMIRALATTSTNEFISQTVVFDGTGNVTTSAGSGCEYVFYTP